MKNTRRFGRDITNLQQPIHDPLLKNTNSLVLIHKKESSQKDAIF